MVISKQLQQNAASFSSGVTKPVPSLAAHLARASRGEPPRSYFHENRANVLGKRVIIHFFKTWFLYNEQNIYIFQTNSAYSYIFCRPQAEARTLLTRVAWVASVPASSPHHLLLRQFCSSFCCAVENFDWCPERVDVSDEYRLISRHCTKENQRGIDQQSFRTTITKKY